MGNIFEEILKDTKIHQWSKATLRPIKYAHVPHTEQSNRRSRPNKNRLKNMPPPLNQSENLEKPKILRHNHANINILQSVKQRHL